MKTTDKFLLFLYLLALTCLFGAFILIPVNYITSKTAESILEGIYTTYRWYYVAGAAVLILLNLKLIIGLLSGGEDTSKKFGIVKATANGELNISHDAIKTLVLKTANQTKGIRDITVMIKPGQEKINILIRALILPDLNIPSTVGEVQENVRRYVESIAEIPVGEVKVVISDIAAGTKLRIE